MGFQKLVHLNADLGDGEIFEAPNTAPGIHNKKTNTEALSNKTEHTEYSATKTTRDTPAHTEIIIYTGCVYWRADK